MNKQETEAARLLCANLRAAEKEILRLRDANRKLRAELKAMKPKVSTGYRHPCVLCGR